MVPGWFLNDVTATPKESVSPCSRRTLHFVLSCLLHHSRMAFRQPRFPLLPFRAYLRCSISTASPTTETISIACIVVPHVCIFCIFKNYVYICICEFNSFHSILRSGDLSTSDSPVSTQSSLGAPYSECLDGTVSARASPHLIMKY